MIDLRDNYYILNRTTQGANGLFYIDDKQKAVPSGPVGSQGTVLSMNSIVRDKAIAVRQNTDSVETGSESSPPVGQENTENRSRKDDNVPLYNCRLGCAASKSSIRKQIDDGTLSHA